jgi:hypothetical protein
MRDEETRPGRDNRVVLEDEEVRVVKLALSVGKWWDLRAVSLVSQKISGKSG